MHHQTLRKASGALGITSESKIGYLFIETGRTDDGLGYEALKLELKSPLERKNQRIIPACTVKIIAELDQESHSYREPQRTDHVKVRDFILSRWARTNLEEVLPTNWFFSKEIHQQK